MTSDRPTTRSGRRFLPLEARVQTAVARIRELAERQHALDIARQRRRQACVLADWIDLRNDLRADEVMARVLLEAITYEREAADRAIERLREYPPEEV